MDEKQVTLLLAQIKNRYTDAFPDTSIAATKVTISEWYNVLRDISVEDAHEALDDYISDRKNTKAPTIREFCYYLRLVAGRYEMEANVANTKGDKAAVADYLTKASAARNYHLG